MEPPKKLDQRVLTKLVLTNTNDYSTTSLDSFLPQKEPAGVLGN
jgi:hypothetical protein